MSKVGVGSILTRPGAICALLACWLALTPSGAAQTTELDQLLVTGRASYMRGDYMAARESLEQAWKLVQETAPDDPVRYDILKRLAAVQAAAGQTVEADDYLRQAINWRQNQFGPADPTVIDDLLEDATLCRAMHEYERALAVLDQVRALHILAGGFDSAPVAADLSRIAQNHMDQKKPENAAEALTAAVSILTKLFGEDHPSLLPDLDRLGEVQIALRQYDKAEGVFRQALVIRERVFGKDHANLLTTVDGLAYAFFGQKKYDEAEPFYQRLVGLWENSAGKEHPMVAMTLDKVAIFYREQKKWAEGQEAADRANAIRAHFLATGLAHEATERLGEGKKDEAEGLYRRALAALDPPHPVFEELRKQIESNVKLLSGPAAKPAKTTPRRHK